MLVESVMFTPNVTYNLVYHVSVYVESCKDCASEKD